MSDEHDRLLTYVRVLLELGVHRIEIDPPWAAVPCRGVWFQVRDARPDLERMWSASFRMTGSELASATNVERMARAHHAMTVERLTREVSAHRVDER